MPCGNCPKIPQGPSNAKGGWTCISHGCFGVLKIALFRRILRVGAKTTRKNTRQPPFFVSFDHCSFGAMTRHHSTKTGGGVTPWCFSPLVGWWTFCDLPLPQKEDMNLLKTANHLRLVVFPIIYTGFIRSRWLARCLPSKGSTWNFLRRKGKRWV